MPILYTQFQNFEGGTPSCKWLQVTSHLAYKISEYAETNNSNEYDIIPDTAIGFINKIKQISNEFLHSHNFEFTDHTIWIRSDPELVLFKLAFPDTEIVMLSDFKTFSEYYKR